MSVSVATKSIGLYYTYSSSPDYNATAMFCSEEAAGFFAYEQGNASEPYELSTGQWAVNYLEQPKEEEKEK